MNTKLFIDDERFPPDDGEKWTICRNIREVQAYITSSGCPEFISFDHDLGLNEPSGFDIVKWLVETDMDDNIIPNNLTFYVHSQNPVGAENIRSLLTQYLIHKIKR